MADVVVRQARSAGVVARGRVRSLAASVFGNALEWYDWNVYAVFAAYLASALFNQADHVSALLSTFAVFAVGFVTRPLGGVVFGVLADRIGRRAVLVVTMLTTAGSSLVVGLVPDYGHLGTWSSVILLLARLAQGMGHGGESSAAYAYVAEIAPRERRGLWSSSVFLSVSAGTLLATGLGALLTAVLPPEQLATWGWRVPFLLGGLLGLFALHLRRTAVESEVFESSSVVDSPQWSRARLLGSGVRIVVISAGIGVMYYSWIVFGVGNAVSRHGMPGGTAFLAAFLAQLLVLFALPLWGRLSDRIGRRPVVLVFAVGSAVLAFPITGIVTDAGWTLFAAEFLASVLWAAVASVYPAVVSELLPTRSRSKGIGIASSLSNAVFGGTAPYLGELLEAQHLSWVFTCYIIVLCLLGALAVLTMPETRGADLSALD
ncbi:MFS transporter [Kutzneria albida]|uniref:Alpha-ketoglutarate permease n=1 Tax=Kutzneria albida DSM 43870 TaxID=1449976 RepID=W5W9N8_9PSEU|nr:MFS transporter [Kutzneria albida]AHH97251.1 alpha-ketoglutarate permease [Kutzneria albida DSM 43870]